MTLWRQFVDRNVGLWKGLDIPPIQGPTTITIHNTAGPYSAAQERLRVQHRSDGNRTGFHFAVDEKGAIQLFPLDLMTYHCGNAEGNASSIAIEICRSCCYGKQEGLYRRAEENAVVLCAWLLKKFNLDIKAVRGHFDWVRSDGSTKYCPHRILRENRWESFLKRVAECLDSPEGITLRPKDGELPPGDPDEPVSVTLDANGRVCWMDFRGHVSDSVAGLVSHLPGVRRVLVATWIRGDGHLERIRQLKKAGLTVTAYYCPPEDSDRIEGKVALGLESELKLQAPAHWSRIDLRQRAPETNRIRDLVACCRRFGGRMPCAVLEKMEPKHILCGVFVMFLCWGLWMFFGENRFAWSAYQSLLTLAGSAAALLTYAGAKRRERREDFKKVQMQLVDDLLAMLQEFDRGLQKVTVPGSGVFPGGKSIKYLVSKYRVRELVALNQIYTTQYEVVRDAAWQIIKKWDAEFVIESADLREVNSVLTRALNWIRAEIGLARKFDESSQSHEKIRMQMLDLMRDYTATYHRYVFGKYSDLYENFDVTSHLWTYRGLPYRDCLFCNVRTLAHVLFEDAGTARLYAANMNADAPARNGEEVMVGFLYYRAEHSATEICGRVVLNAVTESEWKRFPTGDACARPWQWFSRGRAREQALTVPRDDMGKLTPFERGVLLLRGEGCACDPQAARDIFSEAAERGDVLCRAAIAPGFSFRFYTG